MVIEEPQRRIALPPSIEPVRAPDPEPSRVIEPAAPGVRGLVISEDSVVGLQVETSISSEQARVEDEVVARVTRDVRVGDRVAIPAGARAHGEVTLVERGGRLRDRARLGIRFTSVSLRMARVFHSRPKRFIGKATRRSMRALPRLAVARSAARSSAASSAAPRERRLEEPSVRVAGAPAVMAGGRNPATLPSQDTDHGACRATGDGYRRKVDRPGHD